MSVEMRGGQQELVSARFDAEAGQWQAIYDSRPGAALAAPREVRAEVIRERHTRALAWIDALSLPAGSRVLEIGGGAGLMTVALAQRGFQVEAVDVSAEMVTLTLRNARTAGCEALVRAQVGDACALPFADNTFDLVVALGVVSWLAQPEQGVREMSRVVRPGGHVLVTAFNALQLPSLLDPARHPLVRPAARRVRRHLEVRGVRQPAASVTYHRPGEFDRLVRAAGLRPVRRATVGFGPFTVLGKPLLPDTLAIRLHRRLQHVADRGVPLLHAGGMFYLVLARKG
jgi:ubiquinone/menaquinone biosynthesis C-methylase UbiE